MTDARLPERWLTDRRVLRLSHTAWHLFTTSLMWAVSNRTDGVLHDDDLPLMPGVDPGRAAELEKVGLWARKRGNWHIVDWKATQTTRDELEVLENIRRADRDKKRRLRAAQAVEESDARPGDTRESPGDSPGERPGGQHRQGEMQGKAAVRETQDEEQTKSNDARLSLVAPPCLDCGWGLDTEAHAANCEQVAS